MRHRFFWEDDLIKIGWGDESSLAEWDAILAWVVHQLDNSPSRLHILIDFSAIYEVSAEIFPPTVASRLAEHPQAGYILLVSFNPVFVHFVNQHWITQADEPIGLRAFLDVSDALGWLRGKPL